MKPDLIVMEGVAATAGAAGLTLLLKPAAARRAFGLPEGEPALYGLRIAGAMLAALGLFLGGFAAVFSLASAV